MTDTSEIVDIILRERRGSQVLRDALRTRSARQFQTQVALANALSRAVQQTAREHRLRMSEVIDGLICSLCSVVQSQAPEEEWADVGATIAEEVQRRMCVTGVT